MSWRTRRRGTPRQRGTKFRLSRSVLPGPSVLDRKLTPYVQRPRALGTSVLKSALRHVLLQIPVVREVYSAFLLGKSVYEHWDVVMRCVRAFRKKGVIGVSEVLGREILEAGLPSLQTRIIWSAIGEHIPPNYRQQTRDALSKFINNLTPEEIDYVGRFLG